MTTKHVGIKASDINVNEESTIGHILDNLVDAKYMYLYEFLGMGERTKFTQVVHTKNENLVITFN